MDGKTLEGSLPASAIGETEDFDQARRQAVWMDTPLIVNHDPRECRVAVPASERAYPHKR